MSGARGNDEDRRHFGEEPDLSGISAGQGLLQALEREAAGEEVVDVGGEPAVVSAHATAHAVAA